MMSSFVADVCVADVGWLVCRKMKKKGRIPGCKVGICRGESQQGEGCLTVEEESSGVLAQSVTTSTVGLFGGMDESHPF